MKPSRQATPGHAPDPSNQEQQLDGGVGVAAPAAAGAQHEQLGSPRRLLASLRCRLRHPARSCSLPRSQATGEASPVSPTRLRRTSSSPQPASLLGSRHARRQQRVSGLQPLTAKPGGHQPQRRRGQPQRRATSVFQATGFEDIRLLLGPLAWCGAITRYKMLLMGEQLHEADLAVASSPDWADWAGEPAWESCCNSRMTATYAAKARQHLLWWGGALAPLSRRSTSSGGALPELAALAAA